MNAHTQKSLIAGPVGHIEIAIDLPDAVREGSAAPRGIALVAHPHPLFGGTMDNKVAQTLARIFVQLNYAVIRSNFRGVGATEGEHDNGAGEVDDLLAVLAHNGIPYELVASEACCGMPLLEQGNLEGVAAKKAANIPVLARHAREGHALIGAIPSCVLMYKSELPLMFPDDADVRAVADAFWDPFEYMIARHRDGLLKTDFKHELGVVSYHVPCHARVQNIGRKAADALSLVPGTKVKVVERCSGHAGTFGVKREFHAQALKIGSPVFNAIAEQAPDYMSSDCALAGHHIEEGIGAKGVEPPPFAHPITLLRRAYGI